MGVLNKRQDSTFSQRNTWEDGEREQGLNHHLGSFLGLSKNINNQRNILESKKGPCGLLVGKFSTLQVKKSCERETQNKWLGARTAGEIPKQRRDRENAFGF